MPQPLKQEHELYTTSKRQAPSRLQQSLVSTTAARHASCLKSIICLRLQHAMLVCMVYTCVCSQLLLAVTMPFRISSMCMHCSNKRCLCWLAWGIHLELATLELELVDVTVDWSQLCLLLRCKLSSVQCTPDVYETIRLHPRLGDWTVWNKGLCLLQRSSFLCRATKELCITPRWQL